MSTRRKLGSEQAYRAIHQPISVFAECLAIGLACEDQRRLTGSSSVIRGASRRCAIQIHVLYFTSVWDSFSQVEKICDTLAFGRYAEDLTQNREIYIPYLYSTPRRGPHQNCAKMRTEKTGMFGLPNAEGV